MNRLALITGATAGIGKATAIALSQQGYRLVLCGRRADRLEQLQKELDADVLVFDISKRSDIEAAIQNNSEMLSGLSVLINNAGLAKGVDKVDTADLDDWDAMMNTNVKGLMHLTRLTLPMLEKNQPSHIVNIGSVAGRGVYPGGAVYCASKFAVRAFSEGLRMDLMGKNIRVTNISPGMVETEFSEVRLEDAQKAKDVYQGMTPLAPEDIAETIAWSLARPKHVNIQEMVVYPTDQASMYHVHRQEENA